MYTVLKVLVFPSSYRRLCNQGDIGPDGRCTFWDSLGHSGGSRAQHTYLLPAHFHISVQLLRVLHGLSLLFSVRHLQESHAN